MGRPRKPRKGSTRKATKIIGKQTFINQETGEIQEMQVISIEERDANFHKLWLAHIVDSLDLIGNKKLKVLTFIIENLNAENLFLMTYKEIAKHTGISEPTIVETFKALQESNFLKKIRNGTYQVNPDVIFKGGKGDRMNVLIQYRNIPTKKDEPSNEDSPE